jgi:transglutaminase-like putative cysteine protease
MSTSWRFGIEHRTRFRYEGPVAVSYNEARLTPQTTPTQLTLDARVDVEPPAHVTRYWDYWGTLVHAFDVHEPHTEMVVTSRSVVERVHEPASPRTDPDWDVLDATAIRDRFCELLAPSPWVPDDAELAAVGARVRAGARSPRRAVEDAVVWVRDQLEYRAGTTTVSTSAVEAWHSGRGVCQDFVHLSLAVLRAAGVPARYVSGYLHPDPDAEVGVRAVGESHAWVETWTGDWWPIDPTNPSDVALRHVVVAYGRDYGDVAPLKGIYSGGPSAGSEVTVEVTRIA